MAKTKQIQTEIKVTKNMTIGDVVEKYPEVVETLLSYGLHCVGCHVNAFETLEQGASGHGMSKAEIDKMIKDVNNKINKSNSEKEKDITQGLDKEITITDDAARKIAELARKDKKPPFLRLSVVSGGCNGHLYSMKLGPKQEGDLEFNNRNVKVFVDKDSMEKLNGVMINYVDNLNESGFKIDNPNAKSNCGCGKSSGF
ncbi:MAG: iron-sulfur cluster assembly accessory protein [Candidatus Nanoarchaeia archaeon]